MGKTYLGARIPGNWKYRSLIYPMRGKGLGKPKIRKTTIRTKDDETKLLIDGFGEYKCPDNEFLTGNTYNFIEREPNVLAPIYPEVKDQDGGVLKGYNQIEREWFKNTCEDAHRYEKKKDESFLDKYGAYIGMMIFASLILMHQFWSAERDAQAIGKMAKVADQYTESMKIIKDTVAMKEGYYTPVNGSLGTSQQDPPNVEDGSPP